MPKAPVNLFPVLMQVIDLLRQGNTLTRACRIAGTTPTTFRNYCSQNPEFAAMANDAEDESYDRMAEALVEIDTDPIYGTSDPKMAGVMSKNIMFLVSRRRPNRYGDRLTVQHEGADKIIASALEAAINRIPIPAPQSGSLVIEHQPATALPIIDVDPEKDAIAEMLGGIPV